MDALRRHRRPVTAASLADELSVSVRTIYRDVQSLVELGAPIDGEAGLGYLLRGGFFLPPLMFDEDELEALVLGARLVERQGDAALSASARNVLAKIAAAAPKDLRDMMSETGLWVPRGNVPDRPELKPVREAIRREHKLAITYGDEKGAVTERTIWPIGLGFFEGKQTIAAWCELQAGVPSLPHRPHQGARGRRALPETSGSARQAVAGGERGPRPGVEAYAVAASTCLRDVVAVSLGAKTRRRWPSGSTAVKVRPKSICVGSWASFRPSACQSSAVARSASSSRDREADLDTARRGRGRLDLACCSTGRD